MRPDVPLSVRVLLTEVEGECGWQGGEGHDLFSWVDAVADPRAPGLGTALAQRPIVHLYTHTHTHTYQLLLWMNTPHVQSNAACT